MNCHYCQQETKHISTSNYQGLTEKHEMCKTCHVAYIFHNDVLQGIDMFAICIGENNYLIHFNLDMRRTILMKQGKDELYVAFDYLDQLVDWTPTNAHDKLKLLLPFL